MPKILFVCHGNICRSPMAEFVMKKMVAELQDGAGLECAGSQATGNKVSLLMDWVGESRDVADPWYTGDFVATWNDVNEGCRAMLQKLLH